MEETLWKSPIILEGKFVRLEPLSLAHVSALAEIGCEESIWRWMLYGQIRTEADMLEWVHKLLERQAAGTDLPFAVVLPGSGKAVGATRYMEMRPEQRGLEIGGTWYGLKFQRTAVNAECKYLLLEHAFERLDCIRVQFKADLRNERSWRALERIGAKHEGILRKHTIRPDGVVRDSIYYSIIDSEWNGVKARLQGMLGW